MPSSVTDRTTCQHEFIFMLTKSPRYSYDQFAIRERAVADHAAGNKVRSYTNGLDEITESQHKRRPAGGEQYQWRNKRSVWDVNTEAAGVEHFAAYPRDLVKPIVLAGTSERGVCPVCLAPWERIVRKSGGTTGKDWNPGYTAGDREKGTSASTRADTGDGSYRVESIGWKPGCKHTEQPRPSTVMDVFAGTGTTGLVALEYGRHFIGIELSGKYCEIAKRRLAGAKHVLPGLFDGGEDEFEVGEMGTSTTTGGRI